MGGPPAELYGVLAGVALVVVLGVLVIGLSVVTFLGIAFFLRARRTTSDAKKRLSAFAVSTGMTIVPNLATDRCERPGPAGTERVELATDRSGVYGQGSTPIRRIGIVLSRPLGVGLSLRPASLGASVWAALGAVTQLSFDEPSLDGRYRVVVRDDVAWATALLSRPALRAALTALPTAVQLTADDLWVYVESVGWDGLSASTAQTTLDALAPTAVALAG